MSMRDFKGKSTLVLVEDFCVISVKVSSAIKYDGDIIELSSLKIRNGVVVDTFDQLLKPRHSIFYNSMVVTNISNAMVKDSPLFSEIIDAFKEFIGDDILVSHSIAQDYNPIYDSCVLYGVEPIKNDFIDTLRLSRRILTFLKNHSMVSLCDYFKVKSVNHRAIDDCYTKLWIYQELKKRLSDEQIQKLSEVKSIKYNNHAGVLEVDPSLFNTNHKFYNKRVAIGCKIPAYTRKQIVEMITNAGGSFDKRVSRKTDYIIWGDEELQWERYGDLSTNQIIAENHIKSKRSKIEIIYLVEFEKLIADYKKILGYQKTYIY